MSAGKQIVAAAPALIIPPKIARYADSITRRWQRGVKAIIETGQLLETAKADCAHGEWQVLIEALPFGERHAHRLRALAAYMPFRTRESDLPSDAHVLYELSRLPEDRFEKLLEDGVVNPAMARNDLSAVTRVLRRTEDEARVACLAPIDGKFNALVIDPPWRDEDMSDRAQANTPYATMKAEEIAALPVPAWAADDCHLYLWCTNNRVGLAAGIMAAWGFEQKSLLTWIKTGKNGARKMSRGRYFRNRTEQVLFGVRGKMMTRRDDIPTDFDAPVGAHSEKPETFYRLVRRASYPAFGEAFQGKARKDFKNLFEGAGDG